MSSGIIDNRPLCQWGAIAERGGGRPCGAKRCSLHVRSLLYMDFGLPHLPPTTLPLPPPSPHSPATSLLLPASSKQQQQHQPHSGLFICRTMTSQDNGHRFRSEDEVEINTGQGRALAYDLSRGEDFNSSERTTIVSGSGGPPPRKRLNTAARRTEEENKRAVQATVPPPSAYAVGRSQLPSVRDSPAHLVPNSRNAATRSTKQQKQQLQHRSSSIEVIMPSTRTVRADQVYGQQAVPSRSGVPPQSAQPSVSIELSDGDEPDPPPSSPVRHPTWASHLPSCPNTPQSAMPPDPAPPVQPHPTYSNGSSASSGTKRKRSFGRL